jgi:hypothetical protein
MSTPYLPFTTSIIGSHDDTLTLSSALCFLLIQTHPHSHTSLSLDYHTMLYTSILVALTAIQVLAQDDSSSSNDTSDTSPSGVVVETVNILPTAAPSEAGNYESAVSPSASSDYSSDSTSEYASPTFNANSESSQIDSSTTSSSSTTTSSAAPLASQAWMHIKYQADPTKCLAIFDTSHHNQTAVV